MDPPTIEGLQKVWFQTPYVVYFRINDQESFRVANLSLAEWIPLIHDDQRTVNYIRSLVESGAVVNKDAGIKGISRSKNNVEFHPIDLSDVDMEEILLPQHKILLDEFEAIQDIDDYEVNPDAAPNTRKTSSTMNTPPGDRPAKSSMKSTTPISLPTSSRTLQNVARPVQTAKKTSSSMSTESIGESGAKSSTASIMNTPPLDRPAKPSTKLTVINTKTPAVKKLATPISLPASSRTLTDDPVARPVQTVEKTPTSMSTESIGASGAKSSTSIPTSKGMFANRTAKSKSAVWDSFTKIDATTARCQICTKMLKHGGNTTNLMQHLVRKHLVTASIAPGPKQKTEAELNTVYNKRKRGVSENDDDPPPKNADSQMRRKIPDQSMSKNQQIDKIFQEAHSFADGGTSSEKITNAILFMLATDNCPLATVENEGFRTLMKTAVPRYNVPSRRTITRLMDDKYTFADTVNSGVTRTKLGL